MSIFNKFFTKFAYKFPKGYPDINDEQDVILLENILSNFLKENIVFENFNKVPTQTTAEGIDILKKSFNLEDSDFIGKSGKTFYIYVPKIQRKEIYDKILDLEGFEDVEQNKVRYKNESTFFIKPKDSSESYNIKPQNVGVKGDYEYSINELLEDVKKGLNNHPSLSQIQKEYLIQYLTNEIDLTPDQTQEVISDGNFLNQVQKNFSEISGVIYYVENILKEPTSKIEFPIRGNEPLVDSYVIKPDGSRIRVSSKAKSGGNIIKPEGLLKASEDTDYMFDDGDKEEILNIINDYSALEASLKLSKYGDEKIQQYKSQIESARETDPKLKQPQNRQLHYDFERELIRQINSKFNFSDIFNDLLDVIYVKTSTSKKTGIPKYSVVNPGSYRVVLQSKNTNNPTRALERIGFQMRG